MILTNKHIVLILIIIIIFVFIYNYDVYIVPKNEPICKPVYITKRELSPEQRAELNASQTVIFKESFGNLLESNYFEGFESMNDLVPPKNIANFNISSLTDANKIRVIDSVTKVLSYIPTNYNEKQIKEILEYYAMIYQASPDLETFYKNIASSTKISEEPYNSKYSHLVLFLIGKFHSDLENCLNPDGKYCSMEDNQKKNNFDIKPEDIPELINSYYVKKEQEALEEEAEHKPSHIYGEEDVPSEKSKGKIKKKKQSKQKVLDELISKKIQEKLYQESNFDLTDAKSTGFPNVNDGPSSSEMKYAIDRSSMSTRMGDRPDIRNVLHSESEDTNGSMLFNPGRFNPDCRTCSSNNTISNEISNNISNNDYYYKNLDNRFDIGYGNQIESFNSMNNDYLGLY